MVVDATLGIHFPFSCAVALVTFFGIAVGVFGLVFTCLLVGTLPFAFGTHFCLFCGNCSCPGCVDTVVLAFLFGIQMWVAPSW